MAKTKLELTWIGKETRPELEPRILLEDARLSYHAPQRVTEHDPFAPTEFDVRSVSGLRSEVRLFSAKSWMDSICGAIRPAFDAARQIRLDFLRFPTDTWGNTPAPPKPLCGTAYLGQVFLCTDGISVRHRSGRHE